MPRDDVFGKTFECSCGRTHHVEPGRVVYAADDLEQLPRLAADVCAGRRAAVLSLTLSRRKNIRKR